MQGGVARDVRADVRGGRQALQEGDQARELAVGAVVVPGRDWDAVVHLVPEHLRAHVHRDIQGSGVRAPRVQGVCGACTEGSGVYGAGFAARGPSGTKAQRP